MIRELLNQYIWLADTIYRARKITFDELNKLWIRNESLSEGKDLNLRTFHRHRDAIESLFDINIECDKSNGYIYYIENADEIKYNGMRSWLLNTLSVNNIIKESHKLKNQILFEEIPSGQKYLTPIIEAMRDNLQIELCYQSFNHIQPSTFIIYPYCVKVFHQRWYVIGYSPYYEKKMIYSLDRINDLSITKDKFKYPKDFDPQTYFKYSYGIIIDDSKVEEIEIKVYGDHRRYLRTLPLHSTQKEVKIENEYSIFQYTVRPTFDFMQELLSQGDEIEVISPKWVRDEMINKIKEMGYRYKNKSK